MLEVRQAQGGCVAVQLRVSRLLLQLRLSLLQAQLQLPGMPLCSRSFGLCLFLRTQDEYYGQS